jgi:hypothetical protein
MPTRKSYFQNFALEHEASCNPTLFTGSHPSVQTNFAFKYWRALVENFNQIAFMFITNHLADLAFEISPHRRIFLPPNKHHPDITGTGMLSTKGFGGGWPMSSVVHARFSGFGRSPSLGTE